MTKGGRAIEMSGAVGQRRKLRRMVLVFFLLIALPLTMVIFLSMSRLADEAFLQQRFNAQQTEAIIATAIARIIEEEEARPSDQYSYLTVSTGAVASQQNVQRSPLSELPQPQSIPGLVGYFQVDADGTLTSPLLPTAIEERALGTPLMPSDLAQRQDIFKRIETILTDDSSQLQVKPRRSLPAEKPLTNESRAKRAGAADYRAYDMELRDDAPSAPPMVSQEALIVGAENSKLNSNSAIAERYLNKKLEAANEDERQREFGSMQEMSKQKADDSIPQSASGAMQRSKVTRKEEVNSLELKEQDIPILDKIGRKDSAVEGLAASAPSAPIAALRSRITSFEAEIDPLQATRLKDGHLVIFRKVWRGEKRIIQGLLVDTQTFLAKLVEDGISTGSLTGGSSILISYDGEPLIRVIQPEYDLRSSYLIRKAAPEQAIVEKNPSLRQSAETLLFNAPLNDPLSRFEIFFSVNRVPLPPGSFLLVLLGGILSLILVIGLGMIYRLGSAQISLAQKRSDFVSAVSHELKTPLTSIRMYGEMLKNDWVSDETKKRSYYDYIFQESERLSRLIANVLRFSRLTGTEDAFDLQPRSPQAILDVIVEKATPMAQSAGFTIIAENDSELTKSGSTIQVDDDAMSQIAINLIDNAIKFSKDAQRKEISVGFRAQTSTGRIIFFVRDFGPGVSKSEQRKIFELFYRSENELTRKTTGTGIGLALVRELATRMGARIDYRSCDPGAEFQVVF